MKTLCITGFAHPSLHTIADYIFSSGLATARASEHKGSLDIEAWHQQVIAQYQGLNGISQVGRLWEQLAADIFLNNLQTPAWGWSSTQSLALLDFWQKFDTQVYFVLVCVSPQQALAHAIAHAPLNAGEAGIADLEKALQDWHHAHQTMLRFHLSHPERSMLLMADDVQAAPAQLIEHMALLWDLPLNAAAGKHAQFEQSDAVAHYLAQRQLETRKAEKTLHQEVLACVTPLTTEVLSADDAHSTTSVLSPDSVILAYRQLCDRSQEAKALEQAHAELDATRIAQQQQVDALSKARDELQQLCAKQLEQLGTLEQIRAQLSAELAETKQENELLLTQLHQVQEELEAAFIKQQHGTQQLSAANHEKAQLVAAREALNKQVADLTKSRDEHAKLAAERKAQIEALTKDKATLVGVRDASNKQVAELTKARDTLNKQVAELTKSRDEHVKLANERKAQLDTLAKDKAALVGTRDALNKQVAELTKARDEQAKMAADRKAQLDALTKSKNTQQAELRDAREEGDLLLNQLHQVQEELEHYFVEHQQAKQTNEALEKRLRRVYTRMPNYCDYSNVEVSAAKDCAAIDWRFENLEIAGRVFNQLQCRTQDLDGGALIRFLATPEHPLAFLRSSAQGTLVDIVVSSKGIGPMPTLDQLGTSDIAFLTSMAHLFEELLQGKTCSQLPVDAPTAQLRQELAQLPIQLQALPARLRFDDVQLKNNHGVPGYEHLWLTVHGLSLGTQQWDQFEFRLGCANTETAFGTDPKLEFPQATAGSPLTNWFVESNDEYGDKLELRFAQPDAMDLSVWSQLSDADHDFLRALLFILPNMLTALQTSNVSIERSWQEWGQLAQAIRRILELRAPVEHEREATTLDAVRNANSVNHDLQPA